MGNCSNWVLGFCDDSWAMRNDMVLDLEGIFLLFFYQRGQSVQSLYLLPTVASVCGKASGPCGGVPGL